MNSNDETKKLLEQLMNELHARQASTPIAKATSYLLGADDKFLGNIDSKKNDPNSISNRYGPYGSKYSSTSIFNQYSPYGSPYGVYSLRNPSTFQPPKLFLNDQFIGNVSSNPRVQKFISADDFLGALKENISSVADGSFLVTGKNIRAKKGESFIEAEDKTFLGSLNPNNFDKNSIFNEFGPYGSKFSPTSIFNKFGTYGSPFSPQSPYNQFSVSGPRIYLQGKILGTLTKNTLIQPRIDPDELMEWARRNVEVSY